VVQRGKLKQNQPVQKETQVTKLVNTIKEFVMKRLCVKILVTIIIVFFLASPAVAKKKKKGKQVIDYDAITIDGKLKKPEGMFIMDRKELKFKRFLNLNESFLNNIVKSIDEF